MRHRFFGITVYVWIYIAWFLAAGAFFYFFEEVHWIGWLFVGGAAVIGFEDYWTRNDHRRNPRR